MGQDIEQDLFFLLHDVARLIRVAADKRARVDGMTRAQWALLLRLKEHPGLSQKEVADMLEVEPITVARLADRLEQSGMIERRADAADRRIWRLHLRAAADPVLARINAQRAELARLTDHGVPEDMRDVMRAGLLRMKANLLNNHLMNNESLNDMAGAETGAAPLKEIA